MLLERQASDVAARSRKTFDKAGADRIVRHRKDNGYDRCRVHCRAHRGPERDDDIDVEPDEIRAISAYRSVRPSAHPPIIDRDGTAFDPAELAQPRSKAATFGSRLTLYSGLRIQ